MPGAVGVEVCIDSHLAVDVGRTAAAARSFLIKRAAEGVKRPRHGKKD
jgi:hypothetical protein